MNARRLGALAVAIALVAGALLLRRGVLDDDGATATTGPDAPAGSAAATSEPARDVGTVVCATELAAVCDELAARHAELTVRTEDAGVTLEGLGALVDSTAAPIWITLQPFPAMVDELRRSADAAPLAWSTDVVGATPLALAVPTGGRADVLAAACPDGALWRCAGDAAGSAWTDLDGGQAAWGTVRPSPGRVDASAGALGGFAAAVGGYLGTATYSRSTWEADPAFTAWVRRLVRAVPVESLSGGTPLATMATRPALDVAATDDAELAALGSTAARFDVRYPEPAMWLEAVVATPGGAALPGGLVEDARAALSPAWQAPETAVTPLPSATTMVALRQLWEDAS